MSDDTNQNNIKDENLEDVFYEKEQQDLEDSGSDSSNLLKKIKDLKSDLEQCKKEKQEYLDGWQRSQADFINFKKRSEEDKKNLIKYAVEDFIIQLLPTIESFDQAFKNKEAWEKAPPDWRIGIEFIHSQLVNVLTENGVSEINPENQFFDPKTHHSIENVDVEEKEKDGKIVEVIQKGYKLQDRVIKYPTVKVGRLKN
ncbi:MAG TPA: nucleotide exchange factor GrpE [Candidatus Paceibacterota bacterium]|nr:nucleotide exchange factor GrpE [Candidatus Paceibacterota bacterium]HMP18748.1 nucleotide exchange factor GrpE [Candidatus Paceibacterota bacterium]HMP85309.1 nucleotide exchange factor GrpE [Candidatus Paceibacterota bacterium]